MLFKPEEAFLLLTKLEEIYTKATQGCGPDYLAVISRVIKSRDERHTLQKLQIVRLALAKYYARCGVYGVGGRQTLITTQ